VQLNENQVVRPPPALAAISRETVEMGFAMGSDALTGSLLRTLAASRRRGSLLEIGTGTGLATAWMLDGMDDEASLLTVDSDPRAVEVARRHLGVDRRVRFHVGDGAEFLEGLRNQKFDLVFADTWPGKYDHLENALDLLKPGGIYIVDDMLPQPNWPTDHQAKVDGLLAALDSRLDLVTTGLQWSTGIVLCTRRHADEAPPDRDI
jgi:predicted O-methyltransferase YrrM